jgi:fatty-acyl-CoA synthase
MSRRQQIILVRHLCIVDGGADPAILPLHAVKEASLSSKGAWLRALEGTATITQDAGGTFPALIDSLADKFGAAPALLSDQQTFTYRALAASANQYARWALRHGLSTGDVVCLFMHNSPSYMAIWLGISRIGGTVALINTNLAAGPLAHSINIVAPRYIIVGADLVNSLAPVLPQLRPGIQTWIYGASDHDFPQIDREIALISGDSLDQLEFRSPTLVDRALYIYTSGTTGLPKAANVSHFRVMQWSHWFAGMMDTRPDDRMYNCLPMYHSIGGVVASTATLVNGGSVVLRGRFSASQFWDDIIKWDCTIFQYIGELCRYLVNSPPSRRDADHRLRLCCGNGLRSDIWHAFKQRFRIPQILEFYAATEGNFSLYNCDEEPGAIGRIPGFLAQRFHVALVKIDTDTAVPIRSPDGFCIRCATDEIGEAIGRIRDDTAGSTGSFEGYADVEASEKKVLRDAFARGDKWFRTGDLMRKDSRGYFYFVDRVGDTFRWKGENVSTAEVAEAIASFPAVLDAVVYGVSVPGSDGRAGMASIVVRPGLDLDLAALRQHLETRLPTYARPLFLRIRGEIETTATFKPKKHVLVCDGYDPAATVDPIYYNDQSTQTFLRVDADLYQRFCRRTNRL